MLLLAAAATGMGRGGGWQEEPGEAEQEVAAGERKRAGSAIGRFVSWQLGHKSLVISILSKPDSVRFPFPWYGVDDGNERISIGR
jgi:hypothetical protein